MLADGATVLAPCGELPEAGAEIGAAQNCVGRETDEHKHERSLGERHGSPSASGRAAPATSAESHCSGTRIVSNTDDKFRGKVVLVSISGSWCPNCHDEAPFLSELYKKYRSRGLEIVSLSFEEEAQLKNPVRLRAFIKRYGIDYTVLIPGEPKELAERVPQGVNLSSFPTTFFLGRDGRVRAVHAGFPGKASGEFHKQVKEETTSTVERLLAESVQASSSK